MNIGYCSVCGSYTDLGIDDRCRDCLSDKKFGECEWCEMEGELYDEGDAFICLGCVLSEIERFRKLIQ